MIDLMYAGGLFATVPLTLLALAVLVLSAKKALDLFARPDQHEGALRWGLNAIIQLGGFSFFYGVFAQAIGLYQAMTAIEAMGGVSPAMLAGGLKVSMIAPIYGLLILLVAAICWFVLNVRFKALTAREAA